MRMSLVLLMKIFDREGPRECRYSTNSLRYSVSDLSCSFLSCIQSLWSSR